MRYNLLLLSLLVSTFLCACTQQPAKIVHKGDQDFTQMAAQTLRNYVAPTISNSSYSAPVTHSAETVSVARVESVGVTDLAPPPSAAAKSTSVSTNTVTSSTSPFKSAQPPLAQKPVEEKTVAKTEVAETISTTSSTPTKFIQPVSGKVLAGFGTKVQGAKNDGINIAASKGTPVHASADGEVAFSGNQIKGYGNMVLIKHKGNMSSTYAHLDRLNVDRYDRVKQGQVIGYVGSTGSVTKPQLHFALRDGTKAVDPAKYLSSDFAAR